MNHSIKQLVDRGLELRARLKVLKKELDEIEQHLADTGLYGSQSALKDPEREGRRYLARGSAKIVPVIFTADKLVKSFQHESPMHERASAEANGQLTKFFRLTQTWENKFDDGLKFRKAAAGLLSKTAPAFVAACLARDKHGIPKSDIKIAWDEAEAVKAVQSAE